MVGCERRYGVSDAELAAGASQNWVVSGGGGSDVLCVPPVCLRWEMSATQML